MANTKTAIEWCTATWNPVTGCTKVSAGCDNCYAHTLAHGKLATVYGARLPVVDTPENRADPFAVRTWPERLRQPESWRAPAMIFVNSMSDLFHVDVPESFVREVFQVMLRVDRHTYQVLTKRPGRALRFFERNRDLFPAGEIPAHIWMGTSVENQDVVYRVGQLVKIPAAVRFLSCEPLLGMVDLTTVTWKRSRTGGEWGVAPLEGVWTYHEGRELDIGTRRPPWPGDAPRIHWVIAGGESGHVRRPLNLDHARSLRDQCFAAGVPFLFKQVGGRTPKAGGRLLDGVEHNGLPEVAHADR